MNRRRWIIATGVLCVLLALAVFVRRHVQTQGDRDRVVAYLRALKADVELHPEKSQSLDKIRAILNGRWGFDRMYACGVLGELGPKARPAIPDLIAALNCGDGVVERESARAIGEIALGDPRPVEALIREVKLARGDVSWFSAEALGNIGEPALSAIPVLEKAALSTDDNMVYSAQEALKKLRELQAKP